MNGSDLVEPSTTICTPKFLEFLTRHNIDRKIYEQRLKYRFIRIHPSLIPSNYLANEDPFEGIDLSNFKTEFSPELCLIENSGGFCRMPASIPLSSTALYKEGRVYGMDFSSGAAVLALGINKGEHILELCCAPGAKLCMAADLLSIKERSCGKDFQPGSVTGVDIAERRLFTCRALIKKYKSAYRTRLFKADATSFDILPPTDTRFSHIKNREIINFEQSNLTVDNGRQPTIEGRKPLNLVSLFYAPRHLRSFVRPWSKKDDPHCSEGYDKVLVDAECTHDGSITHVLKYRHASTTGIPSCETTISGSEGFAGRIFDLSNFDSTVLNDARMADLSSLQLELLLQGYRLLKPGGTLVYSTCSLTIDQNEAIIARFIHSFMENALSPISESPSPYLPSSIPTVEPKYIARSTLEALGIPLEHDYLRRAVSQAIRYDPIVSETSGLFIARFRKPESLEPKFLA